MNYADFSARLADLGGAKWVVHQRAKLLQQQGRDVAILTIGEPDCAPSDELIDALVSSLRSGRTGYADGQGEPELRAALARRYTRSTGREITAGHVLCLPGTQTALFVAMLGLVEAKEEVLVGDPYYATYAGVIRAPDAAMVPVPLRPENGFRLSASDIARRITPRSRAILLNSPHNPTGAILSKAGILEIGGLAIAHDLWIISDEVYDSLVFDGRPFASPLAEDNLASRTVVVSSISKSHAAAGFRSGWIVADPEVVQKLLPLAETMLFGNQPFIADMTAAVINKPSLVAEQMCHDYARRAAGIADELRGSGLKVHIPQAGMFALVNVEVTGMSGEDYAHDLLDRCGVAVMPGVSFGSELRDWVRVALTVPDDVLIAACKKMCAHAMDIEKTSSASSRT